MSDEWADEKLVDGYTAANQDLANSWYEHEVNVPAIIGLLPDKGSRVLDFGCGPGTLTDELSKDYKAHGVDSSAAMVKKARQLYPKVDFQIWDGLGAAPAGLQAVDCIVTKLTLEFIPELPTVAKNLRALLPVAGSLIISVQHPFNSILAREDRSYWDNTPARLQIGKTGLYVNKIPHTLSVYINSFTSNGFMVDRLEEPAISEETLQRHNVNQQSNLLPKRLIVRFRAV